MTSMNLIWQVGAVGIALLAGCDDGTKPQSDAAPADAAPSGDSAPACVPSECRAPANYGDLGELNVTALSECRIPPFDVHDLIEDECGDPNVSFDLTLHERGRFADGIVAGTYVIEENDLDPETCAVCARLAPGGLTGAPTCYFATGGTVIIESLEYGYAIAGSVEGMSYGLVDCKTKLPIESACTVQIASMTFDTYFSDICD